MTMTMTRRHRRRRSGGFTLLEMMIAMAILAGGLVWLIVSMSRNIQAENHAKLMTAATFLAREKMVELEDELYEKGFSEFEKEASGTFEDKGFNRYTWRAIVDKIELPNTEQLQTALTKVQQGAQTGAAAGSSGSSGSSDPSGSPLGGLLGGLGGGAAGSDSTAQTSVLGAGAGAIGSQFGIIKDVLEQAIRRVTVKISWTEGRTPREVELVAFYTDVRRVDQAIQIGNAPPGTGGGGGSGGGGSGGGSGGGGAR
jgi:general secretion pathway protein I